MNSKNPRYALRHSELVSQLRAASTMPFRNSFTSFGTALVFALTQGGSGQDSYDRAFTITQTAGRYNSEEGIYHYTYTVEGMDLTLDIHEIAMETSMEIFNTVYIVTPKNVTE